MKLLTFGLAFGLLVSVGAATASNQFEERVLRYEAQDRHAMPPERAVLFVGSSTVERWTSVAADFPKVETINRGLSGSTYRELLKFEKRIIFPYRPSKIVVYSGDNDVSGGDKPEAIVARASKVLDDIHEHLPEAAVFLVSVKPSPKRAALMPVTREVNAQLKRAVSERSWVTFVDIYPLLLGADGFPRRELFGSDRLHMNPKGYAIWATALRPYLE